MSESLFGATPTIEFPDNTEDVYTFATRMTFAVPVGFTGAITGIRFWSATNALATSPSAAVFATGGGAALATKAFAGLTTGAWQTATLDTPQAVTDGQTRDIAVGPLNRYAATTLVFSSPVVNAHITGTAGRFVANAALTFPSTSSTSWYGVDVIYTLTAIPPAGATGKDLSATYYANQLAGTLVRGVPSLTMAAALVKWAAQNPDISLIEALNKKVPNTAPQWRALAGVLNQLASTTDLEPQASLYKLQNP